MSNNPNRIALIEMREVSTCFIMFGSSVHWFIGSLLFTYHPARVVSKTRFLSVLALCTKPPKYGKRILVTLHEGVFTLAVLFLGQNHVVYRGVPRMILSNPQ